MVITIIIFLISIISLIIFCIFNISKCDRLSNENLKLYVENTAIHELYLQGKKQCQCQVAKKMGSQVSDGVGAVSVIPTPEEMKKAVKKQ